MRLLTAVLLMLSLLACAGKSGPTLTVNQFLVNCDPVMSASSREKTEQGKCLPWYFKDATGMCYVQYIALVSKKTALHLPPQPADAVFCQTGGAQYRASYRNTVTGTCSDYYTSTDSNAIRIIAVPATADRC